MLRRQHFLSLCTWYTFLLIVVTCNEYKGLDDTVLFKINWAGADEKLLVNFKEFQFTKKNYQFNLSFNHGFVIHRRKLHRKISKQS